MEHRKSRGTKLRPATERAAADIRCASAPTAVGTTATAATAKATTPFDYFSAVFVLNLDAERDRLARVTTRLEPLGISFERVSASAPRGDEPYDANKPNLRPERVAAARSHRAVLEKALAAGHERVLVLEDDVVFRDDVSERLAHLLPQLQSHPWDVFYFSLQLVEDGGPLTEDLGKVNLGFQTHAYAVTRRAIPVVLGLIDQAIADGFDFDGFEHPDLGKVYAKPILAIQEPNRLVSARVRLGQYFPPFDQQVFLDHCAEARRWVLETHADDEGGPAAELLEEAKRLHRAGKLAEAEAAYSRVLAGAPRHPDVLYFFGLVKHQLGQSAAAIEPLSRALAMRPDCPEFHCNLGAVMCTQPGRGEEGLELIARAIELRPGYAEAYASLGTALDREGRTADAVAAWSRSIELRPTLAEAHRGLGTCLLGGGDLKRGIEHLREAVRLSPKNGPAHNDLGCALRDLGDLEGALRAFRIAAQLQPAMHEAAMNTGIVLADLGSPEEAIAMLEKAISLRPDCGSAHWSLSLAHLASGNFARGWLRYEWRRHTETGKKNDRTFMQPAWNGCDISGSIILVTCEQGLGDTIQFIRYAPMLKTRGARVLFECQPPLVELLRGMAGIDQLIAKGEPLPRFDTHVKLLSLPGIFGTRLGNIPNEVPYLEPDPRREAQWKARLAGMSGFKIGIAWQGNPEFHKDRTRSIPLEHFEPLSRVQGVRLLSLQKNAGAEHVERVSDRFRVDAFDPPLDEGTGAFMDTAAVMRHLDLVITSDTAIAHLAGALGIRVWVALSFSCEWRWLRDRADSPWYPTMRLFRQPSLGNWAAIFERMTTALLDTLADAPDPEPPPVQAPMAPGELIDRLTILQIKAQRVTDPAKLRSVRTELEHLTAVRERSLPAGEQLDELARQLRHVNETLWQIEDDIRAADAAGDFGPQFVELARSVYRTNDRRAELKRRINVLLRSVIRDEKHYSQYGG
jgi:Flp pilus assembly protein TadD/GR25 family glycosyltransferase involved in LPS biosynthesis